jgi:YVTN family beta-propeller protein
MRRLPCFALVVVLAAMVLPAASQTLIGSVNVQNGAYYLTANSATNMVYVVNTCGTDPSCSGTVPGTVTVINGINNTVAATINVQTFPEFAVVNSTTNKIYVSNRNSNTVSVINGATNTVTTTINVGANPTVADVNPITNKIYVVNNGNGSGRTMSVIDGNTDTVTATVTVGNYPTGVAVNSVTNMVYVVNYCGNHPGCNATTAPGTISVINGSNNTVTDTVTVGYGPLVVLVNMVTNKIWAVNSCGNDSSCPLGQGNDAQTIGTVTQIDGVTLATQTVNTGKGQAAATNNSVANAFYVTNNTDNTATFIDGATLTTSTVNVGQAPDDVEVNVDTNTIFVCNSGSNTVTAINGATLGETTVNVGNTPVEAWVNPVANRIYVSNVGDNTVSVLSGVAPSAIQFVPVTPCRLVDTRNSNPIPGGSSQNFDLPQLGECGIPSTAVAYSLNVTVVPNGRLGYLTIWPSGQQQPVVSTMNSTDGRVKANAAIVPAGYQGGVSVFASNTTNVILDIDGYFTIPGSQTLQFYTLTPCRVVDTRDGTKPQGLGPPAMGTNQTRDFPVLTSPCLQGINPSAYSFNYTVVPNPAGQNLSYLTTWPKGETMPVVSTLNNHTATLVANAAIVPAGTGGDIEAYTTNQTDLIIDVNGYFAAPGTNGLSLYTSAPCRVIDTRQVGNGQPFMNELTVDVVDSACAPSSSAQAYVFNATVVPPGSMPFLTLWPNGQTQPVVSTLNASDGFITSNMAIVPNGGGSIDAFAAGLTQLILDISGYFAP